MLYIRAEEVKVKFGAVWGALGPGGETTVAWNMPTVSLAEQTSIALRVVQVGSPSKLWTELANTQLYKLLSVALLRQTAYLRKAGPVDSPVQSTIIRAPLLVHSLVFFQMRVHNKISRLSVRTSESGSSLSGPRRRSIGGANEI